MEPRFPPARISWKAWSRMFTRPRLWAGRIIDISRRHHLPPGRLVRTFPGTCAVFQVVPVTPYPPYITKIFPPQCRGDAAREAWCLRHLAGRRLPVPLLLASGYIRPGWPYLVLGMHPGTAVRELVRPSSRVFSQLGANIRRIHDSRRPAAGNRWKSWPSFYNRRRIELENNPILSRFARIFLPALSHVRPVLLHADLTEDHVLLEKGRLTGLIDFGDARLGPAEYEWPALWFGACRRNPVLFRSFLHGYGRCLHPDWRTRAMAATLLHTFVSRDMAKLAGTAKKGFAGMEPGVLLDRLWPELPGMKKR